MAEPEGVNISGWIDAPKNLTKEVEFENILYAYRNGLIGFKRAVELLKEILQD